YTLNIEIEAFSSNCFSKSLALHSRLLDYISSINSSKTLFHLVNRSARTSFEERQVVVMLGAVVACFFVCLLPFRALTLWIVSVPKESLQALGFERYFNILSFCRAMTYLNSAVNPILYNLMSSKFRAGFLRLCCEGRWGGLGRGRGADGGGGHGGHTPHRLLVAVPHQQPASAGFPRLLRADATPPPTAPAHARSRAAAPATPPTHSPTPTASKRSPRWPTPAPTRTRAKARRSTFFSSFI
ncbi:Octopamine receptor, partial [Gryllus bimaculatus]